MKFKRLWSCVLALAMMTTMVSFQASAYEGSTNDGGYTIDASRMSIPLYQEQKNGWRWILLKKSWNYRRSRMKFYRR